MGKRGGTVGNRNAAHDKPWTRALERHVAQNPDKLRALAIKTLDMALEGDIQAIRELGDRLDGKPSQAITGAGGKDLFPFNKIVVELVPAK